MNDVVDKNKRIIRNVTELPSWYNLAKYDGLSSLETAGWYELLLLRQQYLFWFRSGNQQRYKNEQFKGKDFFYQTLAQSRNDPLFFLTDEKQILLMGGSRLASLKSDKQYFSNHEHAISPLTLRHLYHNESRLKGATRERLRTWANSIYGDFGQIEFTDELKLESEWARSFVDDPIYEAFEKQGEEIPPYQKMRGHDFVRIDLTVPDKILIEQFADYLRRVRNGTPDIKLANSFKYPEYEKWIEYAILPYLDLQIWEIENNVSIPYRVFADAIFPDGDKGEEMIRKTTKKIVDQVVKFEYLDFLATLTAQEIAEKV